MIYGIRIVFNKLIVANQRHVQVHRTSQHNLHKLKNATNKRIKETENWKELKAGPNKIKFIAGCLCVAGSLRESFVTSIETFPCIVFCIKKKTFKYSSLL